MKTLLLTGFEPFGGHAVNPSQLVATRLHGAEIAGHRVVGATLPCVFGRSLEELQALLAQHQPVCVVCLGLAENRPDLTPEFVAVNLDDARIPDNAGQQPGPRPVVPGGPMDYESTLPVHAIVAALRARGFAASVSLSAGTFVCNHVFYGLMHELARLGDVARGGFIHLPPVVEAGFPSASLTLAQLTEAVTIALTAAVERVPRS